MGRTMTRLPGWFATYVEAAARSDSTARTASKRPVCSKPVLIPPHPANRSRSCHLRIAENLRQAQAYQTRTFIKLRGRGTTQAPSQARRAPRQVLPDARV